MSKEVTNYKKWCMCLYSTETCGGVIILNNKQTVENNYITSPGYREGSTYSDHTSCSWLIKAPEGYKVNLIFMDSNLDRFGLYCNSPVCSHWVEIKTKSSDLSITGPR
ncbi:hypothetical protein LSH36_235g02045 [Paralvinella palmiformis]|uniref:CUB domain-containing protein n=1 Tax=Paralvinella palmiformis TaxID=53620 RepID=A0AAD9N622_9ANNE|nr:hypothetical protein LSH36_235g02045 [Paralvinella palmiformis]